MFAAASQSADSNMFVLEENNMFSMARRPSPPRLFEEHYDMPRKQSKQPMSPPKYHNFFSETINTTYAQGLMANPTLSIMPNISKDDYTNWNIPVPCPARMSTPPKSP